MQVTVSVNTLEELDLLVTYFAADGSRQAKDQPLSDVTDWSTWIENKKQEERISWTEFSEQCDICVPQVWRFRNGDDPSLRSIIKMVKAFGA